MCLTTLTLLHTHCENFVVLFVVVVVAAVVVVVVAITQILKCPRVTRTDDDELMLNVLRCQLTY